MSTNLRRRALTIGAASLLWPQVHAREDHTGGDPLGSMQWPTIRRRIVGKQSLRFSSEVKLMAPAYAEDALNVPIMVDARPLVSSGQAIKRIVVVADRNPIQDVLAFEPLRAQPVIAFRLRLQQASPVRALVETQAGPWHVGHSMVEAAGGGCTVPGVTRADGSWSKTLNQVQARLFSNPLASSRRLRLRIMHPMDTGLVAGIPAFYLEELELRDAFDRPLWRLRLHEPVSENPILTFELPLEARDHLRLLGRDNQANRIDQVLSV